MSKDKWTLSYAQQEAMKDVGHSKPEFNVLVTYSHWIRFLETLGFKGVGEAPVSFETYVKWYNEFDGWSHGKVTPSIAGWKPEWANKTKPMNELYEKFGEHSILVAVA